MIQNDHIWYKMVISWYERTNSLVRNGYGTKCPYLLENLVLRGESAGNQPFLPFPQFLFFVKASVCCKKYNWNVIAGC